MTPLLARHSSRALAVVLGMALAGCGSSQPDPVAIPVSAPSRPETPRTPPPPPITSIAQLMLDLGIDTRVSLPEDMAPMTNPERKAVLEFFDSFARGDETALGSMLTSVDNDELDELVSSGAWTDATSKISGIDLQTGTSPVSGEPCALAVFYVDGGFQPQLWYYTLNSDGAEFTAVPTPPNLMDRLYGDDWIAAWFEILDEEMALADKPDEEFVVQQREVGDNTPRASRSSGASPGPMTTPSDPSRPVPGGPGRRPKRPKRSAPGKG